jgi:hypothetical protein
VSTPRHTRSLNDIGEKLNMVRFNGLLVPRPRAHRRTSVHRFPSAHVSMGHSLTSTPTHTAKIVVPRSTVDDLAHV